MSIVMNPIVIVLSVTNMQPPALRTFTAIAALLMWIKLFYFLRLFNSTSALIRLIVQTIKDMVAFFAVLLIALFGFANAFYILN